MSEGLLMGKIKNRPSIMHSGIIRVRTQQMLGSSITVGADGNNNISLYTVISFLWPH